MWSQEVEERVEHVINLYSNQLLAKILTTSVSKLGASPFMNDFFLLTSPLDAPEKWEE